MKKKTCIITLTLLFTILAISLSINVLISLVAEFNNINVNRNEEVIGNSEHEAFRIVEITFETQPEIESETVSTIQSTYEVEAHTVTQFETNPDTLAELQIRKLTEQEIFDDNITYSVDYIEDSDVMPYVLIKPSEIDENVELPVIIWLHGANSQSDGEETFVNKSPATILSNWNLTNFNAYIICPQMKGNYYANHWCSEYVEKNIADMLDKFTAEHLVDREKIIVAGASLGGQGSIYAAVNMTEYFRKAVVLCGYPSLAKCSDISIPVIGYVGTVAKGEDPNSVKFMKNTFASQVGEEKLIIVESSHNELPKKVFEIDEDNNGKSDVVEWMFINQ